MQIECYDCAYMEEDRCTNKDCVMIQGYFQCGCGNEEIAVAKRNHNIACGNCGERMRLIDVLAIIEKEKADGNNSRRIEGEI